MNNRAPIIWKIYPLNFEFEGNYTIEISNFGDVRTYSVLYPEGKLLNCSRTQGYPILKKTFLKPRSENDVEVLSALENEIKAFNDQIKEVKASKESQEAKKQKLEELRSLRDHLVVKKKNKNAKINKKRSIYFSLLIHKAVAELFLTKPEGDNLMVIHKDFNKENNKVTNLAWVSAEAAYERFADNPSIKLKQFQENLLGIRTVNVRATKLTENDVLYIKQKLSQGNVSIKRLAQKFGVSDMQIYRIKTGENWSHVKTIKEILDNKK